MIKLILAGYLAAIIGIAAMAAPLISAAYAISKATEVRK